MKLTRLPDPIRILRNLRARILLTLFLLATLGLWVANSTSVKNPAQVSGNTGTVGAGRAQTQNPNANPQQQAFDSLTSDLKGKFIADQKEALMQQYAKVTPGTRSEEVYIQHCIAVMQLMKENPFRCLPQTPQPPPPSLFTPVPTVPLPIVPSVDMTTAWGTKLNVIKIPVAPDDKNAIYPEAVTPDGRFLLGWLRTREQDERGWAERGEVVLVDRASRRMTSVHTLASKRTVIYGADADENWVVWAEGPNEGSLDVCAIYSYNLATQQMTQIVKARVDTSGRPLSSLSRPRVDHGVVVWEENEQSQSNSDGSTVKSLDLQTGEVKDLADKGLFPVISWPRVGWLEVQGQPSAAREGVMKRVIVVMDLQTGAKKTLSRPDTPYLFDLHRDSIVWISVDESEVWIGDVGETYQQIIAREDYGSISDVSINDRLLVWQSNEGVRAWDRAQKRLVVVDTNPSSFGFVSGDAFVWTTQLYRGVINVLDSRQLPNP